MRLDEKHALQILHIGPLSDLVSMSVHTVNTYLFIFLMCLICKSMRSVRMPNNYSGNSFKKKRLGNVTFIGMLCVYGETTPPKIDSEARNCMYKPRSIYHVTVHLVRRSQ